MSGYSLGSCGSACAEGVGSGAYRLSFHVIATAGFTLSAYDRHVLGVLLEPIKHDLRLSDTMLGLLQGFAFALCYATAALPVAYLIDRGSRVRVAACCMSIWSVGTACCGLSSGYVGLAAGRAITAISEAGYSPAALSLISDTMSRRSVARATSLYLVAPTVGLGLAFIAGGFLLHRFTAAGGLALPLIGYLSPWRSVLVISSVPGLLLAIVVLTFFREPPRRSGVYELTQAGAGDEEDAGPDLRSVLSAHSRFLVPYIAGCTAILLTLFSLASWGTALISRTFDRTPAAAASLIGPVTLVAGIAGPLVVGVVIGKLDGRAVLSRVTAIALSSGLATVTLLAAMLASSTLKSTMMLFGLLVFSVSCVAPLIVTPLQILIPSRMRGRFHAGASFLFTVVAGGIGPLAVGLLTDHVYEANALRPALVTVCGTGAVIGVILLKVSQSRLRKMYRPIASQA